MARYIRQEQIGHGSWSVVYKAMDSITGHVVAVKELIDEAGIPKQEITVGRQLTHRNVCPIFEYFEDENGSRCLAMQFLDGGNLRSLMQNSGPLPLDKCLPIASQILDPLEAAHLQNIVHRGRAPCFIRYSNHRDRTAPQNERWW